MGKSFGLLKPDCLKRGIEKEVLALIESAGLRIVKLKRVRLTRGDVDIIWAPCKGAYFYNDMIDFSLSGDCIVFVVEEEDAIVRLNKLVGHYDPSMAKDGTIRRLFGTSEMENVIHGALDEETFKREATLFFDEPLEQ